MSITLSALQKQRRDTAANWTAANPTLLAGELGYESDTGKWKVGDGATAWASLAYTPWSQLSYPIVNADIDAAAEIAVSKLADGTARQLLQTDAAGTGVEWASNIDVPGTLDVTGAATFDNNVTVQGDLTVNGTTTTIDTTHLIVEDKNIEIGKVATPTDTTADGGGITLKGSTDKTINWVDATDAWTFSEHVDLASAKEYRIAGTKVLDATSLGSGVTGSSLTSVGTIGTGTWQGSIVATGYGGTGIAGGYANGELLIGKTDGTLAKAALTAGNGIDVTNADGSITVDVDLKANGGLVIESTELAVDLGASGITGTLATSDGGTGQTTYTDGQLLIGKTDGTLAKATLTAGSNVTITNADGAITVASTDTTYTAGDGLDLIGTEFAVDLKANGGLVIESTELAVDLGASSITGTLGVADGGTGQTSYADGELLIGNTTGNTLSKATLTAGTGISITNGNGSISIASTVSGGLPTTGGTLTGDLLMDNQSDVRFGEATANGTNWVAFQGPASIASNVTWTLPDADASVSGYALVSDGSGTLSWSAAGGGATGGGTDDVFYENSQTVTTNYTLTSNKNAMSAGPVTINSGVTVTVPSGQSWVIV